MDSGLCGLRSEISPYEFQQTALSPISCSRTDRPDTLLLPMFPPQSEFYRKFFHIIDSTGFLVRFLYLAVFFFAYGTPTSPETSK